MRKPVHVLVPIDFNDRSHKLVDYVAHWMKGGDKASLLHVISYGYGGLEVTEKLGPFEELELRLRELASRLPKDVSCDVKVVYDPLGPADAISRFVKEEDVDFTFIARRDKHDVFEQWLGSTSLGVVKNAPCDVVVLPDQIQFNPWRTIVLAAGNKVTELVTEERLTSWAGKRILFVHVKNEEDAAFELEKKALLSSLFDEGDVAFAYGIDTVESGDVVRSILTFAHNEKADIIAVQKSDQSLISTLFLKSTTKEIIEKATLPLIFIN